MNKTRLLKLADFLENEVPKTKFNMDTFGTDWPDYGEKATAHTCGSQACALGWATTMPSFRRAGFRPVGKNDDSAYFSHIPVYKGRRAFDAAESFFGMDNVDVMQLFGESKEGHNTPKQVAKNIRRFVEKLV